jgi:hypothetical protein
VLILGLFPKVEALVEGGTFTNVFAHAVGFVWGVISIPEMIWVYYDKPDLGQNLDRRSGAIFDTGL